MGINMKKRRILFVINQFFKGGAEGALLNLFRALSPQRYEIDFLIFDQIDLPNTISLIDEIPEWIHVVNVAQDERRIAFVKKAIFKFYRKLAGTQMFRQAAIEYARTHEYDVAISYGEWFSSSLVANEVCANQKYVWIHADLDKAAFLHPDIITYQRWFDGFLFVSEQSKQAAVARYPMLEKRAKVVFNLVDRNSIMEQSRGEIDRTYFSDGIPVLLTVANVRDEKNHVRQVTVMKRLKEQGFRFRWLNIGSLANIEQTALLKKAIQEAHLEEDFLLLGAMENPYPYIKKADAVCVLSDHESWSMVITEAKTLGVPVIATKTSGGLAQIVSEETGLLCDFSVEDIADKLSRYLTNHTIGKTIRENLAHYSSKADTLRQLEPLLQKESQKVLYVFDNINYISGARNAALQQVDVLREIAEVFLFSIEPCTDPVLNERYTQHSLPDLCCNPIFHCLSVPIREVLSSNYVGKRGKLIRILYAVLARLHLQHKLYDWLLNREVSTYMECFDAICVVSEASKLRSLVSRLKRPKKIQWIHTDYVAWSQRTSWTKAISSSDGTLYRTYDHIVCLSERLRERFCQRYPHLREKTVAIPNFIGGERILHLSRESSEITVDPSVLNVVTVGRMDTEKRFDRLLEIAAELKKHKDFCWYFIGDGVLLEETRQLCVRMGLCKQVIFTGALSNPYPLMKQCDLFVLLSDYEGTPVTIDESKVLGLPVLANNVGGITDMLGNGAYGTILQELSDYQEVVQAILSASQQKYERFTTEMCTEHNHEIVHRLTEIITTDELLRKRHQHFIP